MFGRNDLKELETVDEDFTAEELEEFLAADGLEVRADPVFRERLRRKLWNLVRSRFGGASGDDDSKH